MKKFAIYKAETGYYYCEYIDSLEQLSGTVFSNLITEDKLPVVLDGNGGYFKFSDSDYNFVEIIESDKECPLPLEKMYFKNQDTLSWAGCLLTAIPTPAIIRDIQRRQKCLLQNSARVQSSPRGHWARRVGLK